MPSIPVTVNKSYFTDDVDIYAEKLTQTLDCEFLVKMKLILVGELATLHEIAPRMGKLEIAYFVSSAFAARADMVNRALIRRNPFTANPTKPMIADSEFFSLCLNVAHKIEGRRALETPNRPLVMRVLMRATRRTRAARR